MHSVVVCTMFMLLQGAKLGRNFKSRSLVVIYHFCHITHCFRLIMTFQTAKIIGLMDAFQFTELVEKLPNHGGGAFSVQQGFFVVGPLRDLEEKAYII